MDGALILDKPEGLTSHDVVAAVRRVLPRRTKVGHTGTLDPFATGVLPIVVGRATRLARFLTGCDKRYRAVVAFGTATATCDRTGDVVETADDAALRGLTGDAIAVTLEGFVGTHPQVPPAFSAKKVDGERAYERARRGDVTPPPAVAVTAHALSLVGYDETTRQATIDVHCGAGYYVRALARDLGARLGVPAHVHALRRTAVGPFDEQDARPLDALLAEAAEGTLPARLVPMGELLPHLPALVLTGGEVRAVTHGQGLVVAPPRVAAAPDGHVRLLDAAGQLVAMAQVRVLPGGRIGLQPDVVLAVAPAASAGLA
jgi:tRNA pseudouridine55 synthase